MINIEPKELVNRISESIFIHTFPAHFWTILMVNLGKALDHSNVKKDTMRIHFNGSKAEIRFGSTGQFVFSYLAESSDDYSSSISIKELLNKLKLINIAIY